MPALSREKAEEKGAVWSKRVLGADRGRAVARDAEAGSSGSLSAAVSGVLSMPLPDWTDAVVVALVLGLMVTLLHSRCLARSSWRAAVTPLASIIGSGFLVVGPLLTELVGPWAGLAMLGLCVLAWLFGSAIRFNILALDGQMPGLAMARARGRVFALLDRLSEGILVLAYFISVAYYLNLLGAYVLKGHGIVDPAIARWLTSVVVVILGALGYWRGFRGIERLELGAVSLKLAVIGGLLAALLGYHLAVHPPCLPPSGHAEGGLTALRVLFGCVLLVQGFETSRFLGDRYDATTRVRSMRWAQGVSSAIYVSFLLLVAPLIPPGTVGVGSETEIVDVARSITWSLGPLLVGAAVASQLSAAVADMGGAGGLLAESSGGRLPPPLAYVAVAVVVLVLTWTVNLFGIIAGASRAFAAYYGIQCALAAWLAVDQLARRTVYMAGALLALAVLVLGQAAE